MSNGTTPYISVVNAARETIGKMLAQRSGQKMEVMVSTNGGKTASAQRVHGTNVCHVNLPSLAPDTVLTRAEADRMLAYIVHEVCHLLHTDYVAWGETVKAGERVKYWCNALEDVRIEEKEMRIGPYKAMDGLIAGLVSHLYAESHTALAAQGTTLGASVANAPYVLTILGRAANGYPLPTTSTLHGSLSPKVRAIVDHALARLKGCTSTTDCLVLARELVALEGKGQEGKGEGQKGKGQEGKGQEGKGESQEGESQEGEGQEGEGQEGEGQEGEGQEGEGQEGKGEGQKGEGQKGEGQKGEGQSQEGKGEGPKGEGKSQEGKGEGPKGKPQEKSIEPDLNLGDTTKNIAERTKQDCDIYNGAHSLNTMTAKRVKMRAGPPDDGSCNTLNKMVPPGGVLHGQIARLLMSETRTAVTHHETSGRLDRRALVRIGTGAQDVYSRRDYAPGIDTAVLVLIDLSGSMGGPRLELARATVWALAKAAESAGGKLAIAGFKGVSADTTLYYAKKWSDSAEQCAQSLCALHASSYTPLSATIIAGAADLAAVTATRRILLVLTDGVCDLGDDAVRSACRLASSMGTEPVGIGMNCEQVVAAFPPRYSVNVTDLDQLAKTGLGTLARMLEETGGR